MLAIAMDIIEMASAASAFRVKKEVISLAYQIGKLNPNDTDYIECHGTGTTVGDPIEVQAIHEALGAARSTDNPILIGSVRVPVPLFFPPGGISDPL